MRLRLPNYTGQRCSAVRDESDISDISDAGPDKSRDYILELHQLAVFHLR